MTNASPASDRHVIISGGSQGLGQAIVRALLEAGYRVSTFSRNRTEFVQNLNANEKFFYASADLADPSSTRTFLKSATIAFGSPYALINCAAMATPGLFATMPEEAIRKVLQVNVEGTLQFTKMVVRKMLSTGTGGVILNVSSISSLRGFRGLSVYAFTKGGMDAFTRALARELGEQNIRVNSIAPGYYETAMSHSLNSDQRQKILRRTPLKRFGVPEDVVGSVLFFLSDQASFITGQTLVVDGGNTI